MWPLQVLTQESFLSGNPPGISGKKPSTEDTCKVDPTSAGPLASHWHQSFRLPTLWLQALLHGPGQAVPPEWSMFPYGVATGSSHCKQQVPTRPDARQSHGASTFIPCYSYCLSAAWFNIPDDVCLSHRSFPLLLSRLPEAINAGRWGRIWLQREKYSNSADSTL